MLMMLKVDGLSIEEVARATRSTTGAIKQKVHRAYERLRKKYGRNEEASLRTERKMRCEGAVGG